jgi:hypothetical protein
MIHTALPLGQRSSICGRAVDQALAGEQATGDLHLFQPAGVLGVWCTVNRLDSSPAFSVKRYTKPRTVSRPNRGTTLGITSSSEAGAPSNAPTPAETDCIPALPGAAAFPEITLSTRCDESWGTGLFFHGARWSLLTWNGPRSPAISHPVRQPRCAMPLGDPTDCQRSLRAALYMLCVRIDTYLNAHVGGRLYLAEDTP